jgi:hypothetical protein
MEQLQEAPQSQQAPLPEQRPTLTEASPTPATSKGKPAPRGSERCSHRTRNKGRCRLPVQDPAIGLCFRHAAYFRKCILDDAVDMSNEILAKEEGAYDSTESINSILSNVVELVAKGRLSTRRAAVITYALSLMLRSAVVAERQALNQLPLDYVPRRPIHQDPGAQPDET